jgi:penicillin-binding protein 1A
VPSIALGTQDVSVLEMADAYSTFARGGFHVDPQVITRVTNADGTLIQENKPRRTRVLDREASDTVTYALQRVVQSGTGTGAAFGKPCAGKTGTSEDFGDAWFVGYTPRLTTAVWMGYAEGQSRKMIDVHGRKVNGGSFPASIFNRFMTKATKNVDVGSFTSPASFDGRILGTKVPYDTTGADDSIQHVGAPTTVQHVGPSTTFGRPSATAATTTTLASDVPPEPDEAPP